MGWTRRSLIETALAWGGGLAAWNLPWLHRYQASLAAPTQRKLALLVGINQYPSTSDLQGCITDVELQRELLIHRFGFLPEDILTVTGAQATRSAIETSFSEHLIAQSRVGDVVLFHFSGYGCRILPSSGESAPSLGLVPSDGILPAKAKPALNSLLLETLEILARSLVSDRATLVLDTSQTPSLRELEGNLRGRSIPLPPVPPSPEEKSLQAALQQQLAETSGTLSKNITTLRAAKEGQVATEIFMSGAVCGLFTYSLTQALWEMTPAQRIYTTLARTAEQMAPLRGDRQQLDLSQTGKLPLFIYGLLPAVATSGEGVIRNALNPKALNLKLTGLPRPVFLGLEADSCFMPVGEGEGNALVQLRSRNGFNAQARLLRPNGLNLEGQLLQESLRVLPRQLQLIVALDSQLERIERVDATSALSGIEAIATSTIPGEGHADCILAKIPTENPSPEETPSPWGYGLLGEGGVALPETLGRANEAIKSAVGRLEDQWDRLLALKALNLTQNESSTRLAVRATLEESSSPPRPLLSKTSQRTSPDRPSIAGEGRPSLPSSTFIPQVALGSQLQLRLENHDTVPLHVLLLGVEPSQQTIAYLPTSFLREEAPFPWQAIAPQETVVIPPEGNILPWSTGKLRGYAQLFAILTRQPCHHTLDILLRTEGNDLKTLKAPFLQLNRPYEIARALLSDLHEMSRADVGFYEIDDDRYALSLQNWATLHFVYQAI